MKIEVSPHVANILASWKTSIAGVLAFVVINAPQILDYLQHNSSIDGSKFWFGFLVMIIGLIARDGNVASEQVGAGQTPPKIEDLTKVKTPDAPAKPTPPLFVFLLLSLSILSGCTASVAVNKSNEDVKRAVVGTAQKDVPFIAHFIADTWADHETAHANRLFNAALAENSVNATVAGTLPAPGSVLPPNATIIKVVSEPLRAALQAKHDSDMAQIAIGRQQIYQAVINRFAGNLAAAQALLDGQSNYYKTAGANESTLQAGLDGALAAFGKLAPIISTVKK